MKTYQEYQAQIAELQKLAAAARERETSAAREQIAALMREHGLTAADLGNGSSNKSGKPRAAVPAKYRDEASGQTWSGRGRAPKWLAGKDKGAYLIK
jgi:DNA-binding protein H-NS